MESFAEYGHAIASLGLFTLVVMIMSPISSLKKTGIDLPAGGTPENAYDDPVYRWNRAYLNACETIGAFAACTVAAILAGADPFWVNLFASVFLIARVLHAFVHIRGIGAMNMGPRTILYVLGWACCIGLSVLAIFAVL